MRSFPIWILATLLGAAPAGAGPADVRIVINQYSQYFPGDFRYPELKLEVPQGGRLVFVNADTVTGMTGWGAHTLNELVPPGIDEPRFWTPTLEPGGAAEVSGIATLERGTYDFYCDTHGAAVMRGTLTIV